MCHCCILLRNPNIHLSGFPVIASLLSTHQKRNPERVSLLQWSLDSDLQMLAALAKSRTSHPSWSKSTNNWDLQLVKLNLLCRQRCVIYSPAAATAWKRWSQWQSDETEWGKKTYTTTELNQYSTDKCPSLHIDPKDWWMINTSIPNWQN